MGSRLYLQALIKPFAFGGCSHELQLHRQRVPTMISEQGLLYIEPGQPASPTPVIDHITRRMCAAFRKSRRSDYACGGIHNCFCGACSSDCDSHLPNGDLTNSLCI